MNLTSLIKPEVLSLKGYHLTKREHTIKLDQNENPFGFPASLREKFSERIKAAEWARYPDFHLENVTNKIAHYAGLPADSVLVGSGSNSLIQALLLATLSPGEHLIVPEPTFTLYSLTGSILGAQVISCRLHPEDFSLPMPELLALARTGRPKMLVLCTPNNPTGNSFPLDDMRTLLREFPGLVVIDEAYHEFSRQDCKPLLREHENLVILRTFSKALAMAGLRVGYLLAAPEICAQVQKTRLPYSVNLFAEIAVELALEAIALFKQQVHETIQQREQLGRALQEFSSLRVYPSDANFFLIRCAEGGALFQHLLSDGLLVRDVGGYPGLAGCLRHSVGTAEHNQKLLESVRRWEQRT